jgi:predicted porin
VVKYNGEPTDFNAQLQIDYSGSRQHEILARHNTFGDYKKFSTSASASYNGKEISLDGSYDSTDNNAAQMTLKSPHAKDINARLSLDGTPNTTVMYNASCYFDLCRTSKDVRSYLKR